jgi:signal transduction histidine kinase
MKRLAVYLRLPLWHLNPRNGSDVGGECLNGEAAHATSLARTYLFAAGLSVFGVFARWLLDPLLGFGHAYLGPILAGACVAGTLGFGPACFSIGLGFIASRFFFVWPRFTILGNMEAFSANSAVSLAVSLLLAWMSSTLRRSVHDSQAHAMNLQQEVARRARTESVLRQLIETQEDEKQVLGHDLHDGVLQHVIAAGMLLEALKDHLGDQESRELLIAAASSLDRGIEDGRQLVRGVRPTVLDDFGLEAAVNDLRAQYGDYGVDVAVDCDLGDVHLSPATATAIYRIVQECLSNVRKHSCSTAARVIIRADRESDAIDAVVEDSGRGFDSSAQSNSGFGLVGIQERVRIGGGTCEITSKLGDGTRIHVQLPAEGPRHACRLPNQ